MRLIDPIELKRAISVAAMSNIHKTLEQIIDEQPTIEDRKTGKWIYHDDDDMRFDTYHCSICRKQFTVDAERFDDIGFVRDDLKYCPNCGADMRGERHG